MKQKTGLVGNKDSWLATPVNRQRSLDRQDEGLVKVFLFDST